MSQDLRKIPGGFADHLGRGTRQPPRQLERIDCVHTSSVSCLVASIQSFAGWNSPSADGWLKSEEYQPGTLATVVARLQGQVARTNAIFTLSSHLARLPLSSRWCSKSAKLCEQTQSAGLRTWESREQTQSIRLSPRKSRERTQLAWLPAWKSRERTQSAGSSTRKSRERTQSHPNVSPRYSRLAYGRRDHPDDDLLSACSSPARLCRAVPHDLEPFQIGIRSSTEWNRPFARLKVGVSTRPTRLPGQCVHALEGTPARLIDLPARGDRPCDIEPAPDRAARTKRSPSLVIHTRGNAGDRLRPADRSSRSQHFW